MGIPKTVLAAIMLCNLPAPAYARSEVRTYQVHHALFGNIGTVSDEIVRDGPTTRVVARVEVKVVLFGITLHELRAQWEELWEAGQLESFQATTTRNGGTSSIDGRHEDRKFVVRVSERNIEGPVDVHPAHPWSLQFIHATTLMSPESGRISPVNIADGGSQSILIEGVTTHVRHYVVRSRTTNHLYFDDTGTLLYAEYRDITGSVSFTLQSDYLPPVLSAR